MAVSHCLVTPCVGVWIETADWFTRTVPVKSHPAWVCGLKPSLTEASMISTVTPCVGVWIETNSVATSSANALVTPCVGVWIETNKCLRKRLI